VKQPYNPIWYEYEYTCGKCRTHGVYIYGEIAYRAHGHKQATVCAACGDFVALHYTRAYRTIAHTTTTYETVPVEEQ
jgi:hypothetical protein